MTFTCPYCGGDIGEESCVGCQEKAISYTCSFCRRTVPNPKYKSGITCSGCGKHVVPALRAQDKFETQFYVCNHCEAVVSNPDFRGFSSCEGCKPPKCDACGGLLATNRTVNFWKCLGCGAKSDKPFME